MDRRGFFQRLIGGAAVAAISPRMLSQIVEHPYTKPGMSTVPPPEMVFKEGKGFWVFHQEKLVAWSDLKEVTLEMMAREITETSAQDGWKEYTPGLPSHARWRVESMYVEDKLPFYEEEVMHLVLREKTWTFEADGVWSTISMHTTMGGKAWCSATFESTGAVVLRDDNMPEDWYSSMR